MALTATSTSAGRINPVWVAGWYLLAFLACVSIYLLNGTPLFYFDTEGYLERGQDTLSIIGLDPVAAIDSGLSETARGGKGVRQIEGGRSTVYAVYLGLFARYEAMGLVAVANAFLVILSTWLSARVACRSLKMEIPVAALACFPVILACLGSLPFFTAYLMPDIMTPLMLIMIGLLTVFGTAMRPWEVCLALAIGIFGVTAHISHLAVAILMVPVSALAAILLHGFRWWLPTLLVTILVFSGYVEKKIVQLSAETLAEGEVYYRPFITARLIEDGPGLTFLEERCPNSTIATCALYEALQKSNDPWRFTASHILFEESAELGSYRLLTKQVRREVAAEQMRFFAAVLLSHPFMTTGAFLKNTWLQTSMVRIDMTVPDDRMFERVKDFRGAGHEVFQHGVLTRNLEWLRVVDGFHHGVYVLAGLGFAALVLLPLGVPTPVRVFALMLLAGIFVNAFVCGGVSQPATRYGARVMWLLPFAAGFLFLCRGQRVRISGSNG